MRLHLPILFVLAGLGGLAAVAAAPDPSAVYARFQADQGALTNGSGVVTNWQNRATSGSYGTRHLDRFGGAPRLVAIATPEGSQTLLRLSGGDNLYGIPAAFGSLAQRRTIAAYLRLGSAASGFLFDGASNVGMTRAQVRNGFWQAGIQSPPLANGANADPATLPATTGVWELHFFSFEPLGSRTRVTHAVWGGASVCYTNTQTNALAGLIVGQNVSQSHGLTADLLELLVYDRVPGFAEREELAEYLTNKWAAVLADTNAPPPPPARTPVFVNGQGGYACYRIPAMVTTLRGTLIAVADGRLSNCGDIPNPLDLVARRSTDNGRTWGPLQIIAPYGSDTSSADVDTYPYFNITNPIPRVAAGDASLLLDRTNGRVWVLYDNGAYVAGQAFNRVIKLELRYSDDDGASWSAGIDVEALNPGLRPAGSQFLAGPGNGIQLENGPCAGRLIFPVYVYGGPNRSTLIYSDDHGQSWRLGGNAGTGGGEVQMAETAGGGLLASMRHASFAESGKRYFSRSRDGGLTWDAPFTDTVNPSFIADPTCQGSILRLSSTNHSNASRLVHANAAHASSRVNMTLRMSYDEGRSWPVSNLVYAGSSAYSALAPLATGEVGLLFEIDNYTRIDFVRYSVGQISGGADSLPPYTAWVGERFSPVQLTDPAVAGPEADPDQDGLNNYSEFIAGTNPLDPLSALRLTISTADAGGHTLAFMAVANKSYTVQNGDIGSGIWHRYRDIRAFSTNAVIAIPVNPTGAVDYFRLTTPCLP